MGWIKNDTTYLLSIQMALDALGSAPAAAAGHGHWLAGFVGVLGYGSCVQFHCIVVDSD